MIEKKIPPTAPLDLDDDSTEETPGVFTDKMAVGDAEPEDYANEPDVAMEALRAKQQRNGLLITYGGGAVFFAIIVFLAYPNFKHYFVHDQPHQTAQTVPVPQDARTPHFSLKNDSDASIAPPAGAVDNSSLPPASANNAPAPVDAMPAPASAPQNTVPDQSAAKLDDLTSHVATLQTAVDALNAQKDASAAQLQQMQAGIDALQKQIAAMAASNSKPSPHVSKHHAEEAATEGESSGHGHSSAHNWVLRSATPNSALIGRPGSNDLQSVAVGDMVSGLGRITSIGEHNGQWVVQGTGGRVSQ